MVTSDSFQPSDLSIVQAGLTAGNCHLMLEGILFTWPFYGRDCSHGPFFLLGSLRCFKVIKFLHSYSDPSPERHGNLAFTPLCFSNLFAISDEMRFERGVF